MTELGWTAAERVATHLRARAAERAIEGASIQLGYAVLIQEVITGSDRGGPSQEMVKLAETIVGDSLEELFAAAHKKELS